MKSGKITITAFIILNILLVLFACNNIRIYHNMKNKKIILKSYTNVQQVNENKFGYSELLDNITHCDGIKIISMGKLTNNNSVNIKFTYSINKGSINEEFNKIKQWNNIRNINNIEINMKDIDKWYGLFDIDFIINK